MQYTQREKKEGTLFSLSLHLAPRQNHLGPDIPPPLLGTPCKADPPGLQLPEPQISCSFHGDGVTKTNWSLKENPQISNVSDSSPTLTRLTPWVLTSPDASCPSAVVMPLVLPHPQTHRQLQRLFSHWLTSSRTPSKVSECVCEGLTRYLFSWLVSSREEAFDDTHNPNIQRFSNELF